MGRNRSVFWDEFGTTFSVSISGVTFPEFRGARIPFVLSKGNPGKASARTIPTSLLIPNPRSRDSIQPSRDSSSAHTCMDLFRQQGLIAVTDLRRYRSNICLLRRSLSAGPSTLASARANLNPKTQQHESVPKSSHNNKLRPRSDCDDPSA